MKQNPNCLQSLWCFLPRSRDAQKPVFRTIGIWAMSLLRFLGWMRYVWDLEILQPSPCSHRSPPKCGGTQNHKKKPPATNFANIIFLLALDQAKICDTWSPESDAADQASPWLCQVLHKWGYISLFSGNLPWACVFLPLQLESPHRNQPCSSEKCWSSVIWDTKR